MRKFLLLVAVFLFLLPELQAQCNSVFFEGFETGSYTPTWTAGTSAFTRNVTTNNPQSGTYCLEQTGGFSGHYQGVYTSFPTSTPTDVSYWVKSSGTGGSDAGAYFVIGDANVTSNNGIMFCYMYGGTFRFPSSTSATYPYSANTWYFVEMRNINYTSKTYDIYIDGNLVATSANFRSASTTNLAALHLYNFHSITAWYDNITIGGIPLNILASGTDVACNGDSTGTASTTISTGNPGYSYLWSTGDTTASISNLPAGSYTIVVTDSISCIDSSTVTVSEPSAIALVDTVMDNICYGDTAGSAMVTASGGVGGFTYLWSTGDTTNMIMNASAGTYTVAVTDTNGCMAMDSIMISEPNQLMGNPTATNPTCNGDTNGMISLAIAGGTPGYMVMWSTGDSTNSIMNLAPGTYSFMITDTNGCTSSDSVMVMEPTVVTAAVVSEDVNCFDGTDGTVTLTAGGGTPGYTYMWSNGDTTMNLTSVGAGTYTVTVTDNNGCMAMDSATVTEPASAVSGSASVTNETTGQSNGAIDYTATGGTSPYSFQWSNGATTEDLTGLSGGTFVVTVTDANGCTFTDSVVVESVVGIFEPGNGPSVNVFPNPANQQLNVSISGAKGDVVLQIVAMDGRMIREAKLDAGSAQREALQVGDLANGVYMLRIADDKGTSIVRFTKQ